jgi:hypothetical protein
MKLAAEMTIVNGEIAFDAGKNPVTSVATDRGVTDVPERFTLYQNHPNPFNPSTEIRFDVKEKCRVVLKVLDLLGREVATVADDQYNPGQYSVRFDASGLPSGIYLYRIWMGNDTASRKMAVMK